MFASVVVYIEAIKNEVIAAIKDMGDKRQTN